MRVWRTVLMVLALMAMPATLAWARAPTTAIRLYAIDCGRIAFDDFGMFADTGEYDGTRAQLVAPCFLIRHPAGDLLWDAGVGDRLVGRPEGEPAGSGIRFFADTPLLAQLQQIDVSAEDIDRIAFSHLHLDHTGNAGAFARATWLLNRRELAWAESGPMPGVVEIAHLEARKRAKVQLLDLDHDVFGDGSVRILRTMGHTPGHQVLLVRLPRSGAVILSGDLFHTRANFEHGRMPAFNHSPGETLASIDRVKRLLKATGGRLVIQHDPQDFAALPAFPAYLE